MKRQRYNKGIQQGPVGSIRENLPEEVIFKLSSPSLGKERSGGAPFLTVGTECAEVLEQNTRVACFRN